jgi:hypothetical protein
MTGSLVSLAARAHSETGVEREGEKGLNGNHPRPFADDGCSLLRPAPGTGTLTALATPFTAFFLCLHSSRRSVRP